jgi:hypothetical protein
MDSQRARKTQQIQDAYISLAALDPSHISAVQPGSLCEFFLRHARRFTEFPNTPPKSLEVSIHVPEYLWMMTICRQTMSSTMSPPRREKVFTPLPLHLGYGVAPNRVEAGF